MCRDTRCGKNLQPQKTVKAYKLFRRIKEKLYPLFVDAQTEVPMGVWLDAEPGPLTEEGKVKSKLGPLAYRPGWHAGDLPIARHIGSGGTPPTTRPNNQVWAEIKMADDRDWQTEANNRAKRTRDGEIIPRTAHITDQVPEDGYYRYKTNPNMIGNWLIGGSIKINRILSDDEVKKITMRREWPTFRGKMNLRPSIPRASPPTPHAKRPRPTLSATFPRS